MGVLVRGFGLWVVGLGGETGVRGVGDLGVVDMVVVVGVVYSVDIVHSVLADILLQLYRKLVDQLIIRL